MITSPHNSVVILLSTMILGVSFVWGQETDNNMGEPGEVVDEDEDWDKNITREGQAFCLVIMAGACTMIGSSVVFFPSLASLAKPHILSMALAFAAGIMLYISLIDIFGKSMDGYSEQGHSDGKSFIYANLSFFGGCVLMFIIDNLVDRMLEWDKKRAAARGDVNLVRASIGSNAGDGEGVDKMRDDFEKAQEAAAIDDAMGDAAPDDAEAPKDTTQGKDHDELTHMGWAMAAAIAIHNFPEGMVTYLAYIQEPAVGIALAIGIAIHNIPEGLCVAMPLYYATGRRWYSFMWGTFSGLTEPVGALIVFLVLYDGISGNANGILFGLVSGMMTVISIDELLPTAHKYSKDAKFVTYVTVFGMFFIASSLMLFEAGA